MAVVLRKRGFSVRAELDQKRPPSAKLAASLAYGRPRFVNTSIWQSLPFCKNESGGSESALMPITTVTPA
jgi:hypothetical protein